MSSVFHFSQVLCLYASKLAICSSFVPERPVTSPAFRSHRLKAELCGGSGCGGVEDSEFSNVVIGQWWQRLWYAGKNILSFRTLLYLPNSMVLASCLVTRGRRCRCNRQAFKLIVDRITTMTRPVSITCRYFFGIRISRLQLADRRDRTLALVAIETVAQHTTLSICHESGGPTRSPDHGWIPPLHMVTWKPSLL